MPTGSRRASRPAACRMLFRPFIRAGSMFRKLHDPGVDGVTVYVDDQPAPGGQVWRAVETVAATPRGARLGAAYRAGAGRAAAFRACGPTYEAGSQLWQIEPGFRAFLTRAGKARTAAAKVVILAT